MTEPAPGDQPLTGGRIADHGPPWARRRLPELLAEHGLDGLPERPFPNDGWSGATLTCLERGRERFVLKRTSWAIDWIARHTRDHALREAFIAAGRLRLVEPLWAPYLGAAEDGTAAAILMPDLSAELIAWDRPGHAPRLDDEALDRILEATARLHALPWPELRATGPGLDWPWCPVRERIEICSRHSALRYREGGLAVADRFLAGWDAFDRLAPPAARDLLAELSADPAPLLRALDALPPTGLHGDLKLANIALLPDGRVGLIDWQLTTLAPVAVELGWFLVANVAQLAAAPDAVLERYRAALTRTAGRRLPVGPAGWPPEPVERPGPPLERLEPVTLPARDATAVLGDWAAQADLAILAGLFIRGWRKGLDAEAGLTLPTGVPAADDLAWWTDRAVEVARRRL